MSSARKAMSCLIVLAVFALSSILFAEIPGSDISAARIKTIAELTQKVLEKSQEDIQYDKVIVEVQKALDGTQASWAFNGARLLEEEDAAICATDMMNAALDKELHLPNDAEQQQLAEEKYPTYKIGDQVKIVYRETPTRAVAAEGRITSLRSGYVQLNNKRNILITDMRGIEGNEAEILKLNHAKSKELRLEYLQQLLLDLMRDRATWVKENNDIFQAKGIREIARRNEQNGYTEYQDEWLTPDALFAALVPNVIESIHASANRSQQHRQNLKTEALGNALFALATAPSSVSAKLPDIVVAKSAATVIPDGENIPSDETPSDAEEDYTPSPATPTNPVVSTPSTEVGFTKEEEKSNSFIVTFSISLIVVIIIAFIAFQLWKHHEEKGNDVSKFYKGGKGKLQKKFWAMQEADPENFKYVAYMFPQLSDANNALAHLSYINVDVDGNLKCKKDIYFGAYQHQGKAVCFVGGTKLNYALWREASAILPELPGAEYFKVSEEPQVQVEIPDLNSAESNITSMGVEDITTETGEYQRVYRYTAPTSEEALDFLEKFSIEEEGIIVNIVTEEGPSYSKSIDGIFEL